MRKITSFSIGWNNCGLCCGEDKVCEITTVNLNKRSVRIEKFNGLNDLLAKEIYIVNQDKINELFEFINKMDVKNRMVCDYSNYVCDGSLWELRLRYNNNEIKLIKGTIDLPYWGKTIKRMIGDMLCEHCIEIPVLFGL